MASPVGAAEGGTLGMSPRGCSVAKEVEEPNPPIDLAAVADDFQNSFFFLRKNFERNLNFFRSSFQNFSMNFRNLELHWTDHRGRRERPRHHQKSPEIDH